MDSIFNHIVRALFGPHRYAVLHTVGRNTWTNGFKKVFIECNIDHQQDDQSTSETNIDLQRSCKDVNAN